MRLNSDAKQTTVRLASVSKRFDTDTVSQRVARRVSKFTTSGIPDGNTSSDFCLTGFFKTPACPFDLNGDAGFKLTADVIAVLVRVSCVLALLISTKRKLQALLMKVTLLDN